MHTRSPRQLPILPLALFALLPGALSAATLHLLPTFSEEGYDYALGLSDGGAVVGYSQDIETSSPLLWEKSGAAYATSPVVSLPAGTAAGELRWISADGTRLAGFAARPLDEAGGDLDLVPVVWSRSSTGAYSATILPRLGSGASETLLTGGSAGGTRFIGESGATPAAAVWRAISPSSYSAQFLTLPSDATNSSRATSISQDGGHIVGHYDTDSGTQAVVWTENTSAYVLLKLQNLPAGSQSRAEVISRDGALAAGSAEDASGLRPVTWTTASGAVKALDTLPGFEATVLAIADNKHWLGGRATDYGTFDGTAVLWNGSGQIFDLATLVSAAGLDLSGLSLESVTGIHLVSTGLYTIVGTGVTEAGLTRGFVVENLPLATPAPQPDPVDDTPVTPPVVQSGLRGRVAESASASSSLWNRTPATGGRTLGASGSRSR